MLVAPPTARGLCRPGRQLVPHPFYRENEQPRELAALGNSRIDLRQAVVVHDEKKMFGGHEGIMTLCCLARKTGYRREKPATLRSAQLITFRPF